MADSTMTAACHVAGSVRGMDRTKPDGVVDEFHQEVVLLRVAVIDEEPRVDPAPGLEPVPRIPASDPPPPRDHLASVRVLAEEFDDKKRIAAFLSTWLFVHGRNPITPLHLAQCVA